MEEMYIIALRNSQIVKNGKANTATKDRLKKIVDAKKKAQEKLNQAIEKAKSKKQGLRMTKLALMNCQSEFGTFKAILFDPPTCNDLFPSAPLPIFAAKRA